MKKTLAGLIILLIMTTFAFIMIKKHTRSGNESVQSAIHTEVHNETLSQEVETFFDKIRTKEAELKNLKFKAETDVNGTKIAAKFFKKGNKKRVESTNNGVETISIIDLDAKKSIIYTPENNTAIVQIISDYEPNDPISQYAYLSKEEMSKYSMGNATTKNGYPCQMLITTSETETGQPGEINICISEEYGIPVFIGMKGLTMNVAEIGTDSIEDSMFQIPKDAKIVNK